MPKEFTYKGKSVDELKNISLDEFIKITNSRIRRTLKRGFTHRQKNLLRKLKRMKGKDVLVRTQCRNMPVIPEMIGSKIGVYDGKEYVPVEVKPEMVGHYLGEFVMTREEVKHSAPGIGATRSSKFVALK